MGYHQIAIALADRFKTAFITDQGLFQYNFMPFGLCNAPATFQRLMHWIFQQELFKELVDYIDDLVIYGEELYQSLNSFDRALQKLVGAGLKCKPRKCKILLEKLEFLGHVLIEHGITATRQK